MVKFDFDVLLFNFKWVIYEVFGFVKIVKIVYLDFDVWVY